LCVPQRTVSNDVGTIAHAHTIIGGGSHRGPKFLVESSTPPLCATRGWCGDDIDAVRDVVFSARTDRSAGGAARVGGARLPHHCPQA
jgi:hypothetical protein